MVTVVNERPGTRRTIRYVERTVENRRDGTGHSLWHAVEGWTIVVASVVSVVGLSASVIAVLVAPGAWPAPIVAAFLALPGLVVLNAAVLFARLRRISPERYEIETGGRGFVRHVGSCGRSFLYQLHGSAKQLSSEDGQLRGLRTHARATLLLHRYGFVLLVALVVGALALTAILELTT